MNCIRLNVTVQAEDAGKLRHLAGRLVQQANSTRSEDGTWNLELVLVKRASELAEYLTSRELCDEPLARPAERRRVGVPPFGTATSTPLVASPHDDLAST